MKSCDEMVKSLFERKEEYVAAQRKKRKIIARSMTLICCVSLAALLSFEIQQTGTTENTLPSFEDGSESFAENDCTDSGSYPNNYIPDGSGKIMISSYDTDEFLSASYEAPQNGEVGFSIPLKSAMDEYGDSVLYHVILHVFSDEEQLYPDSSQIKEECKRLSDQGYTVAYETYYDGESYHYYFTLHASYEELISFSADENYGYFMFLYDELTDAPSNSAAHTTAQ